MEARRRLGERTKTAHPPASLWVPSNLLSRALATPAGYFCLALRISSRLALAGGTLAMNLLILSHG